jgi:hypothetical protein
MSSINPGTIDNAVKSLANGNVEAMRTLLNAMAAQHLATCQAIGIPLLEPTSGGKAPAPVIAPPPPATLNVTGANGAHNITIANPPQTIPATIYHQLSYSPNPNYSGAQTLPPSPSTSLSVPMPGTTLSWRIRSSYDQVHWNAYAPAQGNAPVDAGLQSSAATSNATALNQTNYATVDSIAAGSTANVRVYGSAGPQTQWIGVKGGVETVFPSATIINQTKGTKPYVAFDGEQFLVEPTLPQVFGDDVTPVGQVGTPQGGSVILPTVVAVISGGSVIGYTVTSGGSNIGAALALPVSGDGTGATTGAQTIVGGVLQSVTPGNLGTGYTHAAVTPSGGASTGTAGGGTRVGNNPGRYVPNLPV